MRASLLLAWPLLFVVGDPQSEPSACLLQQGSSELKRAALVQEVRQEPDNDSGDRSHDNGDGSQKQDKEEGASDDEEQGGSEGSDEEDKPKEEGKKEPEKEKNKEKSHGGHDEKHKDGEHEKKEEKPEKVKEDFGSSLRLELWLPVPISDLKNSKKKGPLPKFLDKLQAGLAESANVSPHRIDMLGVRGAYEDEGVLSFFARDVKASLQDSPVVVEEPTGGHSIVDLEVLPATSAEDPSPKAVLDVLKEDLGREDSPLMSGSLKGVLSGAKLLVRQGVEGLLPHERSGAASVALSAAVFLPLPFLLSML